MLCEAQLAGLLVSDEKVATILGGDPRYAAADPQRLCTTVSEAFGG